MDLDSAVSEFIKYADTFDIKNEEILRKKGHSIRVMEISRKIATMINLDEDYINLATLIGLLHDLARFEQYKKFKTYNDKISFDHGDIGANMLLNGEIRKYIKDDKYDDIIIKAVKNHNKFAIEDGLNEKEILFSKIVRDADKLDIFYVCINMIWNKHIKEINDSIISEELIECFEGHKLLQLKEKRVEGINEVLYVCYFIFDLNFNSSFQIVKENDYINRIFDMFDIKDEYTKNKVSEIRDELNKYITKRC